MKVKQAINPMYWLNKAIDKRLNSKGVAYDMQYNPLLNNMKYPGKDMMFTRRMLENSTLYSGNEQDISYFYRVQAKNFWRKNEPSESMNYFWANADLNFRKIHSGLPQLISEKMVDLIVGNGYQLTVDSEAKETEDLQEELDNLRADNKFNTLLAKAIETESWAGGVPLKLSIDTTLSDYPIIEIWQPENYTNVVKCGRIQKDIFYTYYKRNNIDYRLSEIYGVDDDGAYIDYELHQLQHKQSAQVHEDPVWINIPLETLEETAEYKRVSFVGYFKRLSYYKPNKLPNNEFRNSVMGESDYAGSYGMFDAIDEIISSWIQEVRDGKLNRYFPEEYVPKNAQGETSLPSAFKKDHIIYADSPSDNVDKQKIMYAQGEVRSEKYVESYKIAVTHALNNAGLSPLTVGATGLESIDASAESQQEREKVSIRTRNNKIEGWTEVLEDFMQVALELSIMTKNMTVTEDGMWNVNKIPEFSILATFEDYIIKSKVDRTNEVTVGLRSVWDYASAVEYVHVDKTPKEQLVIIANLKLMNGEELTTAEAAALQDSVLAMNEELAEDGVELIGQENEDGADTEETIIEPPTEETEEE